MTHKAILVHIPDLTFFPVTAPVITIPRLSSHFDINGMKIVLTKRVRRIRGPIVNKAVLLKSES